MSETGKQSAQTVLRTVCTTLQKRREILIALVCGAVFVKLLISVLSSAEYSWQPMTFDWVQDRFAGTDKSCVKFISNPKLAKNQAPFPDGISDVSGLYVFQCAVLDCRFLACLASLANTSAGQKTIFDAIKVNPDQTTSVYFKGVPEGIKVSPLTDVETIVQSHVRKDRTGKDIAQWVPLIEKAYGRYRIDHQDWETLIVQFVRHALFEGRLTLRPLLDSFGATYGSRDDVAFEVLAGVKPKTFSTVIWEIGDYGLGKDYVTGRQIRSWFDRPTIVKEFYQEQADSLNDVLTKGGIAIATTEISPAAVSAGLWTNHAYSVIAFDQDQRKVTIRDPMGKVEPRDERGNALDGSIDGIFEVSLADFNRYVSHLTTASFQ